MDKKALGGRLRLGLAMSFAALALVALDQWTKALAAAYLPGKGIVRLIGDFAVLVYARNRGAFLSLGSGLPSPLRVFLLIVLPIAALAFLAWAILTKGLGTEGAAGDRGADSLGARARAPELAIVVLIAAGGAGNLIDRLLYGEVRDFLHFRLGLVRTGIMNLADLYILAALVVIAVVALSRRRRARHATVASVFEASEPPPNDPSS